jgi:integrase
VSHDTCINFTKKVLLQLPAAPAGTRHVYHDSQQRGLQLIVTARGAKTFYVRKKRDGKSERLYLGRFPELTIEQARRKAMEALGRHVQGEALVPKQAPIAVQLTFGRLYEEYCARTAPFLRRPDKPKQTYRLYLSQWATRALDTLTFDEVDAMHKGLARRVSPVTANIALKLVHTLFNRAKYEWRIWRGENPAQGIKKFTEHSRDRFVYPKEMPYLLAAVELEANAVIRDAIRIALFTGARRANVQAMAWAQLDLEAGLWRIPTTKNGRPQLVHLCPEVVTLLRARRADAKSPWVLPGPGESGHLEEVKTGWGRVLARAEGLWCLDQALAAALLKDDMRALWRAKLGTLPSQARKELAAMLDDAGLSSESFRLDVRFHDLRRTHASWMLQAGAGKHLIGKQLNHLSAQTTEVYARLLPGAEVPFVDTAVAAMLGTAPLSEARSADPVRVV